jgi:hypothetical protein
MRWTDPQNREHVADNLAEGPTLGRTYAAHWQWADPNSQEAACVRLPLGADATELTVLVVYTDVLYAYDFTYGPEDGPAVIASWDARYLGGAWHIRPRNEVGIGCWPDLDENGKALQLNYTILCQSTDQDGNKLEIVKLPMPGNIEFENKRLPASYTNFYIGNKTVLVPTFRSGNDKAALTILQKLFPDRNVVGIDCRDLICGFGAIHCISQQQPIF